MNTHVKRRIDDRLPPNVTRGHHLLLPNESKKKAKLFFWSDTPSKVSCFRSFSLFVNLGLKGTHIKTSCSPNDPPVVRDVDRVVLAIPSEGCCRAASCSASPLHTPCLRSFQGLLVIRGDIYRSLSSQRPDYSDVSQRRQNVVLSFSFVAGG